MNSEADNKTDESEHEVQVQTSKHDREFFITILLLMSMLIGATSSGMAMGYPSVLLPQLKSNNTAMYTDDEMGSWIASIISASMPIGTIISGVMVDRFGRKLTLHIQTGVVVLGWILVALAQSHAVILIGRCISGIGSGLGIVAGQIYISEASSPNVRASLSSAPVVSYAIGILFVYALGAFLEWRLVAGLSTTFSVIAIVMYFFYPESHVWLIRQGRIQEATDACIWFRGNKIEKANTEIKEIITRLENEKVEKYNWKSLMKPYALKPLFITTIFNLLQSLSGVYVVVYYGADIISYIGLGDLQISDTFVTVCTALVRMVFSFLACVLLVYMNRRSLALVSGLSTSLFSFILGICLYCNIRTYVTALCLLFYVAASTIGLLLLPGVMMGELFPTKVRGLAGGLAYTLYSLFTFAVTKVYPSLKDSMNIFGLFWLFGVSSFLLSLFVYLTLPETKDKTLHQVEDYFSGTNILWMNRVETREENSVKLDNLL